VGAALVTLATALAAPEIRGRVLPMLRRGPGVG